VLQGHLHMELKMSTLNLANMNRLNRYRTLGGYVTNENMCICEYVDFSVISIVVMFYVE